MNIKPRLPSSRLIYRLKQGDRVPSWKLIHYVWDVDTMNVSNPDVYKTRLKKAIERARKRGYKIACHRQGRSNVWYELD